MQTTAPAQVHIGRLSTRAGAALLIACVHPLAAPRGAPHHARVTHLCAICGGAAVVRMVGRRGQELRELRRRGQRLCELRQGRRTDTVRCGGAGRVFFFSETNFVCHVPMVRTENLAAITTGRYCYYCVLCRASIATVSRDLYDGHETRGLSKEKKIEVAL